MDKDDKGHVNELHPNQSTSKPKFIKDETKNKLEKSETKQTKKINSEVKPQSDSVATIHSKNSGKTLNAAEKLLMKNKNLKQSFGRRIHKKTLLETERNDLLDRINDETFEFEDLINNSRVMELVQDLVNCFTSNSTLPEKDLQALKDSLFERTCYVFLNILNSCVEKTFTRVLNSDFFQEFKKKHVQKKDACCQTPFPHFSADKEGQVEENVLP